MSSMFTKPISENKIAASLFAVRAGIAFVFFWAGNGKVSDPAGFSMMLQNMVGMEANTATTIWPCLSE